MTNVFVGPEAIQKVLSSMFGVPFRFKFRHKDTNKVLPRKDQRMFFAVPAVKPAKENCDELRLLKKVPKRFFEFGQLYRVVYNQNAVKHLLNSKGYTSLEAIYVTGLNIFRYNKKEHIWSRVGHNELSAKELYKEDTQMSQIKRLFYALFPSQLTVHQ